MYYICASENDVMSECTSEIVMTANGYLSLDSVFESYEECEIWAEYLQTQHPECYITVERVGL